MIVTETDARTKWCPFARVPSTETMVSTTANRERANITHHPGLPVAGTHCIASKCMAWRWLDGPGRAPDQREGYCGAAGSLATI